jgi:hypothetical protein
LTDTITRMKRADKTGLRDLLERQGRAIEVLVGALSVDGSPGFEDLAVAIWGASVLAHEDDEERGFALVAVCAAVFDRPSVDSAYLRHDPVEIARLSASAEMGRTDPLDSALLKQSLGTDEASSLSAQVRAAVQVARQAPEGAGSSLSDVWQAIEARLS